MAIKKMKKMELSEYIGYDITLERYHCFDPALEQLYCDALTQNVVLQYQQKNLKQFIEDSKDEILNRKLTTTVEFEKKNNLLLMKKCIFRTLLFLSFYGLHLAGKDYVTHIKSNSINSYLMLEYLTKDENDDGILELDTSMLEDINYYMEPTYDALYNNSNIFYKYLNEVIVSDGLSCEIAMDKLGEDIIEIDNVLYSKTGNITKIIYTEDGVEKFKYTSLLFETEEDMLSYLHKNNEKIYSTDIIISGTYSFEVKTFKEIPTMKKSKENGELTLSEPSDIKKLVHKIIIKKYND